MAQVKFHVHDYTITILGETILLLRKEYELFHFLYENNKRPFTREELLDAVWPTSTPSDRTVDDHIYRLRKKLAKWKDSISIDTIKGYGYQLTVKDEEQSSPFVRDDEFFQLAQGLIRKYHLYGQGSALLSLLEQKEFSIPLENEFKIIQAYLKGDIWWLLQTEELQFSDKLLFLMHSYKMLETDGVKALHFLETAIDKKAFSEFTQSEAESITRIYFAIHAREFKKVKHYMEFHEEVLKDEGFYSFACLLQFMYYLGIKDERNTELLKRELEHFFAENAYQRELSMFHVLKGIHAASKGNQEQGVEEVETGIRIIKIAGFKSHLVLILDTLRFYLNTDLVSPQIAHIFQREWRLMDEEYDFDKLKHAIYQYLSRHL